MPSKAPERHSERKSARLVDLGVTRVPRKEREDQASLAFGLYANRAIICGPWSVDGSGKEGAMTY